MRRMKNISQILGVSLLATLIACGGSTEQKEESKTEEAAPVATEEMAIPTSANDLSDKGIGPITSIVLEDEINVEMAKSGEELYNQMCSACHKPTVKFIGPAPKNILQRRSPEWVMNMIMNPQEMVEQNATAKALLKEYNNVPMTEMGLTEEQTRAILEYFRTL